MAINFDRGYQIYAAGLLSHHFSLMGLKPCFQSRTVGSDRHFAGMALS